MTFEGSCNRDLFEMWLGECLISQLQPGDVIVIDATIHRSQFINQKDLSWKRIQRQVFKLQTRIYRASCPGDVKAVHQLQQLLISLGQPSVWQFDE